jgi:hypothetical protein
MRNAYRIFWTRLNGYTVSLVLGKAAGEQYVCTSLFVICGVLDFSVRVQKNFDLVLYDGDRVSARHCADL